MMEDIKEKVKRVMLIGGLAGIALMNNGCETPNAGAGYDLGSVGTDYAVQKSLEHGASASVVWAWRGAGALLGGQADAERNRANNMAQNSEKTVSFRLSESYEKREGSCIFFHGYLGNGSIVICNDYTDFDNNGWIDLHKNEFRGVKEKFFRDEKIIINIQFLDMHPARSYRYKLSDLSGKIIKEVYPDAENRGLVHELKPCVLKEGKYAAEIICHEKTVGKVDFEVKER